VTGKITNMTALTTTSRDLMPGVNWQFSKKGIALFASFGYNAPITAVSLKLGQGVTRCKRNLVQEAMRKE
jgi:hypothetical protein